MHYLYASVVKRLRFFWSRPPFSAAGSIPDILVYYSVLNL